MNILIVDDEAVVHKTLGQFLKKSGHSIQSALNGAKALDLVQKHEFDMALVDVRLPDIDGLNLMSRLNDYQADLPVVIITGYVTMEIATRALRLGAVDFLNKPVHLIELDTVIKKTRRFKQIDSDRQRLTQTVQTIQSNLDAMAMVGNSPAIQSVWQQIDRIVAANSPTVLITGDTGTGKEVVARQIHNRANTPDKSFLSVICPSLPDTLVESSLFGHVKGAFTGADTDRPGYFELAADGTLFLDEIADLSPTEQAALLGVLESRTVRRVGGSREIPIACRVIAATNADLDARINDGTFRADLYYRLSPVHIQLFPLCDRPEDIVPLAEYFLTRFTSQRGIHNHGFTSDALDALQSYTYPGNVRELRNIVERALLLSPEAPITARHLGTLNQSQTTSPASVLPPASNTIPTRKQLLTALEKTRWNRRQAARNLGITYSKLRYWVMKLGVE